MTSTSSQSETMRWISRLVVAPKLVSHAAVAVGHNIYSFGGDCAKEDSTQENFQVYSTIYGYVLNTSTFTWTAHPVRATVYLKNIATHPYERCAHTAVVYEDKVYIWGGRNKLLFDSKLFCFDTVGQCWTETATTGAIPLPREGHTACLWNQKMIIFGGYEKETDSLTDSVYALDLQKMNWVLHKPSEGPPCRRYFHTAVCINNRMYIFGGRGKKTIPLKQEVNCNVLWYLDLATMIWVSPKVTGDIPVGRQSHSAFVYNNKMYIFGGFSILEKKHFNDMYEFDPAENRWTALHPGGDKPSERFKQACVVVGDKLFLFGGWSPQIADLHERPEYELIDLKDHKFDDDVLPQGLRMDIMNMSTPNKISRSKNWTG